IYLMDIKRHLNKLKHLADQKAFLEKEYQNKTKGTIYYKRYSYLKSRFEDTLSFLKDCGRDEIYTWEMVLEEFKDVILQDKIKCLVSYSKVFTQEDVVLITTLRTGRKVIEIKKISEIKIGFLEIINQ